jgi:hypothetical protein
MSRANAAVGFGESPRSRITSTTGLLASAQSCAQRAQLSLEGLGCVSNLLVLTGVGAGLVASFLSGLVIDSGLRQAAPGFADGKVLAVDLA